MRIVFGHNNFLIKSYTPAELGIPPSDKLNGIVFEVRQHYFHLFWIPFFGIGKIYVIRRTGDSGMYQMPSSRGLSKFVLPPIPATSSAKV